MKIHCWGLVCAAVSISACFSFANTGGDLDKSDWYNEGEIVVLEPFTVTADPPAEWEANWEIMMDDMFDQNLWDAVNQQIWQDFIEIAKNTDWVDPCYGEKEKAQLAKAAYTHQAVGNNVPLTTTEANAAGIPSHLLSNGSFEATIFRNTVTGQITVAFRGTDALSPADWGTDAAQAFGIATNQYNTAMELGLQVNGALSQLGGSSLQFVGHSLGGGLASAAAIVANVDATTFNAAGLHSSTTVDAHGIGTGNADNLIDAYYVGGEILSTAQDTSPLPDAVGRRHRLDSDLSLLQAFEKHGIDAVVDAFPC